MLKSTLAISFCLLAFISFNQDLSKEYRAKISDASHDSVKINLLLDWDDKIYLENPNLDIQLNTEIIEVCKQNLKNSSLKLKEKTFYRHSLARALNNKGLALSEKNQLNEALVLLNESYQLAKKYGFKETESHSTNNIGTILRSLKEYRKAIEFYEKSLAITKDSIQTPETFNNIGLCYSDMKDIGKAVLYFKLSLKFSESNEHQLNKANTLMNMADIYFDRKEYKNAFDFFDQALETNKSINNYHGISYAYAKLANLARMQKQYGKAIEYGKSAFNIAQKHDLLYNLQEATKVLYKIYKDKNEIDKALYYYELHIEFYEKYSEQTNREELIKKEYYYEYLNKEKIEKTKHKKELEVAAEKNKRQRIIISFIILAFIGFLVFLFFVVKSYRKSKKMNALIASQKKEVELKNQEILDSISYAKRIQTAILPTDEYFKSKFKESFILYLPKDIVAGDFYWMEEKDNLLIFAVADCTGHGVPGAMVSVVCHNALNRCVREFNLTNPNEILNKAREIIINEFEKSNEEMKDGMDISLCCLDMDTLLLKWAGANNPFCVVRNKELIEFKADKQPIGNFAHAKDFTMHEIQMLKDDLIYLFSDGYIDQFGGDDEGFSNGKKYKSKRLKSLLIELSNQEIEKQKTILRNDFLKWKGKLDQVDDICIVGIRV